MGNEACVCGCAEENLLSQVTEQGSCRRPCFVDAPGLLGRQMGLLQRFSAVTLACFFLSDQPGCFSKSKSAPTGQRSQKLGSDSSLSPHPPRMGEFCTEILSLLILAHAVWAPDEPLLWPDGWMSPGKTSHHSMSLPFSGKWARERQPLQDWLEKRIRASLEVSVTS